MQEEGHNASCELCGGMHMCVCKFNHLGEVTLCLGKGPVSVVTGETQENESSKSPIFIGNLQYHLMTVWKSYVEITHTFHKLIKVASSIEPSKVCCAYSKANRNYIEASWYFHFCLVDWENLKTNTSLIAKTVSIKNK